MRTIKIINSTVHHPYITSSCSDWKRVTATMYIQVQDEQEKTFTYEAKMRYVEKAGKRTVHAFSVEPLRIFKTNDVHPAFPKGWIEDIRSSLLY